MLTLPKKQLPTTPVDETSVVPLVSRNIVPFLQALHSSLGAYLAELQGGIIDTGAGALRIGSGAPSDATGADGDFYFRTDGGAGSAVYQRRAGVWVAVA